MQVFKPTDMKIRFIAHCDLSHEKIIEQND